MHSQPIPPEVRHRNRKMVFWLVTSVVIVTVLSLIYLVHYGVNFQRYGFH